jgi:putative transposase
MMKNRKTPRAQRHDYTNSGTYFITIYTKNRIPYFGEIHQSTMKLNALGIYCTEHRKQISDHYPHVVCDEFICMPNHIHGIIIINQSEGTQFLASWNNYQSRTNKNRCLHTFCSSGWLGAIIRWFKIGVTKFAKSNNIPFARQGRYHDSIVRDHRAYESIKWYIQQNPKKWHKDRFSKKNL